MTYVIGEVAEKKSDCDKKKDKECGPLPGTLIRIFIPAGAVINLLNILELTSPTGICIILRTPLLGGNNQLDSLLESIKKAGGKIEIIQQDSK